MPRVVAGVARGRRLTVPPGSRTRPTSDRVREALFSTLESMAGPLQSRRVLDLYSGSGALGLEALSRGAAHALLVESDLRAARVIRRNAVAVGCPGAVVREQTVERLLATVPDRPYDVVLADPPYALGDDRLARVLAALAGPGWLAAGAVVVVERATPTGPPPWPPGLVGARERRYGQTTLWYGRAGS